MVESSIEQQALTIVRECREAGFTLQAIADELNRIGSKTRAGSAWKFEYVRNLLRGVGRVPVAVIL